LQEVWLSKTSSILTGEKVLEAPASNTHGFLSRGTYVSSNHLNMSIWSKQSISPLETPEFRKYSFQKLTQFSQGNNVLDALGSNTDGFLSSSSSVSST
jgi:hypothetical protein